MRIAVIIPAYNESRMIENVVKNVPTEFDVIVIDDASTDATAACAKSCIKSCGDAVLLHPINRGLGGALRTGFAYACRNEYDAVVTLDADGQHDPNDIASVLRPILQDEKIAFVVGTRSKKDMPQTRRLYNIIGNFLSRFILGGVVCDIQSGFRAIRVSLLKQMHLTSSRMEISSELIAEAHRLRANITEAPISVRYSDYSMSKGQNFFEGMRTLLHLVARAARE